MPPHHTNFIFENFATLWNNNFARFGCITCKLSKFPSFKALFPKVKLDIRFLVFMKTYFKGVISSVALSTCSQPVESKFNLGRLIRRPLKCHAGRINKTNSAS